jgi:hypothetical protein
MTSPDIRFALPLASENRWSDLLAVLVSTDPVPICGLLDLDVPPGSLALHRELSVNAKNRPDLVLTDGERRAAVMEVKVLSGLGRRQLDRYEEAEPNADVYAVVFPERLVVDTEGSPLWRPLHWETVIGAYCDSVNPWVRTTAESWLAHLAASMPALGPTTQWNDLTDGEDFVIAMRARMSWMFSNLQRAEGLTYDLIGSSAGVSWVLRMYTDALVEGYRVLVEFEERLPVRDYPKVANAAKRPPLGPSAKVVLLQHGITTSAGFDWNYLYAMWPVMELARSDWVTAAAKPKKHDRVNHLAIVAKGAPKYLGIGFGEAQARINGTCMFGARIQLPADISLAGAKAAFEDLSGLVLDMAAVNPPELRRPDNGDVETTG